MTPAGDSTFWAGPTSGDPRGYVLEEWGIDGKLRRSFRRPVSWYRSGGAWEMAPKAFVHMGDRGLLYVKIFVGSEELVQAMKDHHEIGDAGVTKVLFERTNTVVEVIDTRSGELLASETYRTGEAIRAGLPLGRLFRGRMLGYRPGDGEKHGVPFVEIVQVALEGR